MRCPVCPDHEMTPRGLECGPLSHGCPNCHGRWIPSHLYWRWREAHPENLPELPVDAAPPCPPVAESGRGKLCPECRHVLLPYKVGHSLAFSLDRCGTCGGVWLDANEWEALRARNLHDDIHFIFSASWQRRVFEEEQARHREERLRRWFGEEDYAEARRIRDWLCAHPRREELLAFFAHPE